MGLIKFSIFLHLLYFYRHFWSSIPNLNSVRNLHGDDWCIITQFGWSSSSVVNPTLHPPPCTILHSTYRNSKIDRDGFLFYSYFNFTSVPPWEMGTSWPDCVRRIKTLGLLHWRPMASAPHLADKCGHNF